MLDDMLDSLLVSDINGKKEFMYTLQEQEERHNEWRKFNGRPIIHVVLDNHRMTTPNFKIFKKYRYWSDRKPRKEEKKPEGGTKKKRGISPLDSFKGPHVKAKNPGHLHGRGVHTWHQ